MPTHYSRLVWSTLLSLIMLCCQPLHADNHQSDDVTPTPSLDKLISNTLPAVISLQVDLDVMQEHPAVAGVAPKTMVPKRTAGSGFFISPNGIAVTNAHVVKDAKTILVSMQDGHETTAQVIGLDVMTDIAILKVPVSKTDFIPLEVAKDVRVGDSVLAIGNSFGLPQTVTSGIVSALHRNVTTNRVEDFIQTDTSINVGNSGGPLINKRGELVGVNNMIIGVAGGNNGVGFAIPTNIVKNVAEQIIQYGSTQPGQLGVISQNVSPDLATALGSPDKDGALVSEVIPNTPAAKAGLQPKDIIFKVNSDNIGGSNQLRSVIYTQRAGSQFTVHVYRDGKPLEFSLATRSALQDLEPSGQDPAKSALDLFEGVVLISHESLGMRGELLQGIRVIDIKTGTKAWLSGLMPGDVITHIGKKPVQKIADLSQLKQGLRDPLLLEVIRDMHVMFLVMPS